MDKERHHQGVEVGQVELSPRRGFGDPGGRIWLGLLDGDVETVVSVMQEEFDKRSVIVPFFGVYGMEMWNVESWSELNADPRYIDMMTKLNFPQAEQ